MQVLYLGRALRAKETLPDFREKCRVTRHSRVFCGLTGSQRTPGFGASHMAHAYVLYVTFFALKIILRHSNRDASKNVPTLTVSEFYEILRAS